MARLQRRRRGGPASRPPASPGPRRTGSRCAPCSRPFRPSTPRSRPPCPAATAPTCSSPPTATSATGARWASSRRSSSISPPTARSADRRCAPRTRAGAYPLATKSLLLLYDPSVVSEPPATTDALIAQARELTGGERFGLAFQVAEPYYYAPWLHAFGGDVLDADVSGPPPTWTGPDLRLPPGSGGGHHAGPAHRRAGGPAVRGGHGALRDLRAVVHPRPQRPIAAALLPVVSETGEPARCPTSPWRPPSWPTRPSSPPTPGLRRLARGTRGAPPSARRSASRR